MVLPQGSRFFWFGSSTWSSARTLTVSTDSGYKGIATQAKRGDVIVLKPGSYNGELRVPTGTTVKSEPGATIILGQTQSVVVSEVSDVTLDGLTIVASGAPADRVVARILVSKSSRITIRNCSIRKTEASGIGIGVIDSSDVTVESCSLSGNGGKSVAIGLHADRVRAARNAITGFGTGILVEDGSSVAAFDNLLDANNTGINMIAGKADLTGNTIDGPGSIGIDVVRGDVAIAGNAIRRHQVGMRLQRDAKADVLSNTASGNTEAGLFAAGANLRILRNNFRLNNIGILGSSVVDPSDQILEISENVISANRTSGIYTGSLRAKIHNNLIEGNKTGVFVNKAPASISSNTIVLNETGLLLMNQIRVKLERNIISHNRTVGISKTFDAELESAANVVFGQISRRGFTLTDTNYATEAWIPASNNEELLANVVPGYALRSPSDLNIDPEFVELGRDYRLRSDSAVAAKMKDDLPGAFPVARPGETRQAEKPLATGPVRDALAAFETKFVFETARPPFGIQLFQAGDWRTFYPALGDGWWIERHNASRALTAGEQDRVRAALRSIAERWPGLILRATLYRPVRIGAPASDAPAGEAVAQAFFFGNRLRLGPRFFAGSAESQVHTLVHELVHLGDVFTMVSSGADWVSLCGPLLRAVHKEMGSRQLDWMQIQKSSLGDTDATRPQVIKDVGSVIYAQGFPNWLGAKNPAECLAVFGTATAFELGQTSEVTDYAGLADPDWRAAGRQPVPAQIASFIRDHVLSPPAGKNEAARLLSQSFSDYEAGREKEGWTNLIGALRADGLKLPGIATFAAAWALYVNSPAQVIESTQAELDRSGDLVGIHVLLRGEALARMGRHQEAIEAYSNWISDTGEDNYRGVLQYRAESYLELSKFTEAVADLNAQIERLKPIVVPAVYVRLAQAKMGLKDRAGALDADGTAITAASGGFAMLDPSGLADSYLGRARLLAAASGADFDRAMADLNQVLAMDAERFPYVQSRRRTAYVERARLRWNHGDHEHAIADFGEAIKLDPERADTIRERGLNLVGLGEFAAAAADFRRSLQLQNNLYSVLFLYHARTRNGEDALAELKDNASRLKSRAWPYPLIELYLGQRSADDAYRDAKNDEERCEADYHIAASMLISDRAGAAKWYRAALEICPKTAIEYEAAKREMNRLGF